MNFYFRVFNVLKDWLKNAFYDFRNDTALLGTLEKFINKEMAPTMENPANTLQSIIKKKVCFFITLFIIITYF